MTVTKSPRLIRRGDVVMNKGTDVSEIVRGVQIVLQLANGASDVYSVDEEVVMGEDNDISPAELVAAAQADAEYRAQQAAAEQVSA